ncbi:unnamed protein product [Adineta ricciae]|uniref:Solute carrier organic anion transporter family member n=1 Tax=Adineta ricciae TaxID=249248 RepID=A0A813NUT1_ADIRI|nr:unnamed protein product [Adineta ricciae]
MTPKIVVQPTPKPLEGDVSTKYHLFGWRNRRFHGILSQPLFAYIILCICNFIQNFTVNGANNAVISTLERVFYLDSVQSGLFLALYDVATVFSSPLVGYLGGRYSSPIFFSLNMIIVGVGNMLIASSNFVQRETTHYTTTSGQTISSYNNVLFQCTKDPFNEFNITDISCLRQERLANTAKTAKLLLYLGNFVNGIGSVALFTIGVAYIERIFPRGKAAYCQGIYFAVGTVGGALGIVATGRFLLIYTKLSMVSRLPHWLTPNHPLWVGCWWLPYFIYGGCSLLIGLFVSGLPNFEKPGEKHLAGGTVETNPNPTNLAIQRQDSPTSISMLSSCPPTPANYTTSSNSLSNDIHPSETSLPALKPLTSEYILSNRRVHQLSPLEPRPTSASSLAINTTNGGVINHGYSTESLPIQMSPADMTPSTLTPTLSTVTESSTSTVERTLAENCRRMCSVIRDLLTNTRYVAIIIASLFEGILIKGFVPFITKYFEYQHQLDTSTATLLTGAIALLSVVIGCPIGAYCMNKFSWTPMRCARVCGIVFSVSAFLFLFLILSCPELKFEYSTCSNVNSACCRNIYYPGKSLALQSTSSHSSIDLVCMETNPHRMFLSPCHFGCTNQTVFSTNNTSVYNTCNCAGDDAITLTETACRFRRIPCEYKLPFSFSYQKNCHSGAWIFGLTMTGAAFVVFFTAFIQVPLLQVLLYSVPLHYQSMALGVRQTIVRVLGQTTGPLLFGFVFDESCLFWLTDCYSRRTCKVYNNRRMGMSMALSGFSTRLISGIACIVVFTNWKLRHSNEVIIPPNSVTAAANKPAKQTENGQRANL